MRRNRGISRRPVKYAATSAEPTKVSGVWSANEVYNARLDDTWPVKTPPVPGMYAWYTGGTWDGFQWTDISGNNRHATTIAGTINQNLSYTGNGADATFPVIYGGTTASITFPSSVLPSTFTFFHVTRYNGANEHRIFDGTPGNWLSGFHGAEAGVAYHDGWITPSTIDYHGTNWVISTDQNSKYRSKSKGYNSGNFQEHTGGGGTSKQLTINAGAYSSTQSSDWMIAEIIVYNSTLSATDYNKVESYLEEKYGI